MPNSYDSKVSYYPCGRLFVQYDIKKEPCHQDIRQVFVRHVDGMFFMPEAALKGKAHQLTRSRGDISSIKYVKLVDKDTKTDLGLQKVMLLSLPKLRLGTSTCFFIQPPPPKQNIYISVKLQIFYPREKLFPSGHKAIH